MLIASFFRCLMNGSVGQNIVDIRFFGTALAAENFYSIKVIRQMTRCQHHTSITVEIRKLCTHKHGRCRCQAAIDHCHAFLLQLCHQHFLQCFATQATVTTDCHAKRTAALCCQPVAQARSNLPNRLLCQCHLLFFCCDRNSSNIRTILQINDVHFLHPFL